MAELDGNIRNSVHQSANFFVKVHRCHY